MDNLISAGLDITVCLNGEYSAIRRALLQQTKNRHIPQNFNRNTPSHTSVKYHTMALLKSHVVSENFQKYLCKKSYLMPCIF
jgi:hypothetical protein